MFLGELVEAPRGSALYHYKRGYLKSQIGTQNVLLYETHRVTYKFTRKTYPLKLYIMYMSKFAQSISVEQKRFNPTPNLQRRRPKPDVTAATSTVAAARTSSTAATSTAAAMYQTPAAFTPAAVISTSAATTTTAVFAPANVTPHLPKGWNKVIKERDRQWISRCLYESKNVARRSSELRMWYDPPHPKLSLNINHSGRQSESTVATTGATQNLHPRCAWGDSTPRWRPRSQYMRWTFRCTDVAEVPQVWSPSICTCSGLSQVNKRIHQHSINISIIIVYSEFGRFIFL